MYCAERVQSNVALQVHCSGIAHNMPPSLSAPLRRLRCQGRDKRSGLSSSLLAFLAARCTSPVCSQYGCQVMGSGMPALLYVTVVRKFLKATNLPPSAGGDAP